MKTPKKITDPTQIAYAAARRCGKHYHAMAEFYKNFLDRHTIRSVPTEKNNNQ